MSNAFDKLMSQSGNRDVQTPSTSGTGRPMHDHWSGYRKSYNNGRIAAKCINCMKLVTNTARDRLIKHRKKCDSDNIVENELADSANLDVNTENLDDIELEMDSMEGEVRSIVDSSDDSRPNSRHSRPSSSLTNYSVDSQDTSCSAPKQPKLKRFLDQVKPIEAENIDSLLAEFFFGCNIPFQVVDSKFFKKFVHALRPAYNIPHRHLLAGNLLDKTHEKIEKCNVKLIEKMDKKVILLVDGWQNSSANRHYVATMLATSNDQEIFLELFNFSTLRETGENLFNAVQDAITLAEKRYGAEVYAILTDNAFNMQKMGNACRSLNILYSTCNAHSANLLAGDILQKSDYKQVMKKVMKVQKDFRRTALANRLLDAGGHKPILSCTTRWTSQRGAAESMIKNLSTMKTVTAACDAEVELDKKPKRKVASLLFNEGFSASVRKLLTILNPVAVLTSFCQQSTASSADAAEKWLELLTDGPEDLRPFLKYRVEQSNVLNTMTMTANYLHPIYRGKRLSKDQLTEVNTYLLDKLDADQLESLRKFTENENVFANLVNKKGLSAITFWHFASELGHRKLAEFAKDYLKIPASTAQLERLFSNWAYIHSDIRNKLSDETSKKLVNMYFTLRSTDELPDMDNDDDIENFSDNESESESEMSE